MFVCQGLGVFYRAARAKPRRRLQTHNCDTNTKKTKRYTVLASGSWLAAVAISTPPVALL